MVCCIYVFLHRADKFNVEESCWLIDMSRINHQYYTLSPRPLVPERISRMGLGGGTPGNDRK
jgi:hypothetical protein